MLLNVVVTSQHGDRRQCCATTMRHLQTSRIRQPDGKKAQALLMFLNQQITNGYRGDGWSITL